MYINGIARSQRRLSALGVHLRLRPAGRSWQQRLAPAMLSRLRRSIPQHEPGCFEGPRHDISVGVTAQPTGQTLVGSLLSVHCTCAGARRCKYQTTLARRVRTRDFDTYLNHVFTPAAGSYVEVSFVNGTVKQVDIQREKVAIGLRHERIIAPFRRAMSQAGASPHPLCHARHGADPTSPTRNRPIVGGC